MSSKFDSLNVSDRDSILSKMELQIRCIRGYCSKIGEAFSNEEKAILASKFNDELYNLIDVLNTNDMINWYTDTKTKKIKG